MKLAKKPIEAYYIPGKEEPCAYFASWSGNNDYLLISKKLAQKLEEYLQQEVTNRGYPQAKELLEELRSREDGTDSHN